MTQDDLRIQIFADGADLEQIKKLAANPIIRGFTSNPTLMAKAGVKDYEAFARSAIEIVSGRPISFEVFADDLPEMERQARIIASWGKNVFVKIPITNTEGVSCLPLVERLSSSGVKVNVTAIMTDEQCRAAAAALHYNAESYLSIFAGRIADTGRKPLRWITDTIRYLDGREKAQIIWASPRGVLDVVEANDMGCHIITLTPELLAKLPLIGKDLAEYSLETVRMFRRDAVASGFTLGAAQGFGAGGFGQ